MENGAVQRVNKDFTNLIDTGIMDTVITNVIECEESKMFDKLSYRSDISEYNKDNKIDISSLDKSLVKQFKTIKKELTHKESTQNKDNVPVKDLESTNAKIKIAMNKLNIKSIESIVNSIRAKDKLKLNKDFKNRFFKNKPEVKDFKNAIYLKDTSSNNEPNKNRIIKTPIAKCSLRKIKESSINGSNSDALPNPVLNINLNINLNLKSKRNIIIKNLDLSKSSQTSKRGVDSYKNKNTSVKNLYYNQIPTQNTFDSFRSISRHDTSQNNSTKRYVFEMNKLRNNILENSYFRKNNNFDSARQTSVNSLRNTSMTRKLKGDLVTPLKINLNTNKLVLGLTKNKNFK
jgi:hypothetical protein